MSITDILLYIQVSTVIVFLTYGAITDIRKREVEPIVWIIITVQGIITSILYLIFVVEKKDAWLAIGINFAIAIILALLIGYSGAMGGGDALCLFALSVNTAIYPFQLGYTDHQIYTIFPPVFNTFFNWLLVMIIIYPIPILLYNIKLKWIEKRKLFEGVKAKKVEKILSLISGYPITVEKAKNRADIAYSELYNEEKNEWELKLFMKAMEIEEEEEFNKEIEKKIEETGKKTIWVKVLPPGILFLLMGYILNLIFGNIFYLVVLL